MTLRFYQKESGLYEILVFLIASIVPLAISSTIAGPVYQSDEGGYLANALALSGHIVDASTGWHAGFSLLLIPAVLLGNDSVQVFSYVKFTNAVLLGASAVIVMRLLQQGLRQREQNRIAICTLISIAYPSYVILVGFAFSSIAFLSLFTLSAYLVVCVAQEGRWWWVPLGFVCGYLYWIHPLGLAVIAAAAAVGTILARQRNEFGWLAVMLVIAALLAIVYKLAVDPYLKTYLMAVGDFAPDPGYPGLFHPFYTLITEHYLTEFVQKVLGQLFYATSTTYGVIGVLFAAILIYKIIDGQHILSSAGMACSLYSGLSILSVAVVSSVFLAKSNTMQSVFYGRYIEMVMLPALAFSIYLYSSNAIRAGLVAILALGLALSVLSYTSDLSNEFNLVNALSLWQAVKIPYLEGGPLSAAWIILIWMSTAAAVVGWMLSVRNTAIVSVTVIVMFAFAIFTQMAARQEAVENYVDPKLEMVQLIEKIAPHGNCVLFDELGGYKPGDTPNVYSFYFFGFEFRKLRLDGWQSQCSGVILSTRPDLNKLVEGVVPVAENRNDGLVAWVSESDYQNHLRNNREKSVALVQCLPKRCLRQQGFTETTPTKVGLLKGAMLMSQGTEGFLLFGPYRPLDAGKYTIKLYGSAENTESAWVDVVSNEGENVHLKIPISQMEGQGVLAEGRFSLGLPAEDVEVRVHVDKGDILRISGFEVQELPTGIEGASGKE